MTPPLHRCAAACWLTGLGCSDLVVRNNDNDNDEPEAVTVTESFTQRDDARVDLLLVVDDTPSMTSARTAIAAATDTLVASLQEDGLAWQLGVTTTDITGTEQDPGLLRGDPWILTPDTPDPAAVLARTLDTPEGSPPTAGLGAATLALTEPLRSGGNRGLRRPDAALHIVILSDADDDSGDVLGVDPADAFLGLLEDEAAATGQPAVLSAVVGDPGRGCSGPAGTALPGDRYAEVAEATGGATASVCDPDLAGVVAQLGDLVTALDRSFVLQARPLADSLRIEVDGVRQDDGWRVILEESTVVFDTPPPRGASLEVRYTIDPGVEGS